MILAKQPYLIACLPLILSGCAGFGNQQPAPVFEGAGAKTHQAHAVKPSPPPPVENVAKEPSGNIEIKPLAATPRIETVEIPQEAPISVEPLLTPEQEQELAALEKNQQQPLPDAAIPAPGIPNLPETGNPPIDASPSASAPATGNLTPALEMPAQAPAPPSPPAFEPLQSFAPSRPPLAR